MEYARNIIFFLFEHESEGYKRHTVLFASVGNVGT